MNYFSSLLVNLEMSENDRRLLVILLVIFIVVFVLIGLTGMLIRYVSQKMGERIETEIADPIKYHVTPDANSAYRYGKIKNLRLFYKEASIPILILLVTLILWIIYSVITINGTGFAENHFKNFSELFFQFDAVWENNAFNLPTLMSVKVSAYPVFDISHWASYLICLGTIGGALYLIIVTQAFFARSVAMRRIIETAYKKTLKGFNFYDDEKAAAQSEYGQTPTQNNPNPPKQ